MQSTSGARPKTTYFSSLDSEKFLLSFNSVLQICLSLTLESRSEKPLGFSYNQHDTKQINSAYVILETGLSISFMDIQKSGEKLAIQTPQYIPESLGICTDLSPKQYFFCCSLHSHNHIVPSLILLQFWALTQHKVFNPSKHLLHSKFHICFAVLV